MTNRTGNDDEGGNYNDERRSEAVGSVRDGSSMNRGGNNSNVNSTNGNILTKDAYYGHFIQALYSQPHKMLELRPGVLLNEGGK
jgi:hypothetical protein